MAAIRSLDDLLERVEELETSGVGAEQVRFTGMYREVLRAWIFARNLLSAFNDEETPTSRRCRRDQERCRVSILKVARGQLLQSLQGGPSLPPHQLQVEEARLQSLDLFLEGVFQAWVSRLHDRAAPTQDRAVQNTWFEVAVRCRDELLGWLERLQDEDRGIYKAFEQLWIAYVKSQMITADLGLGEALTLFQQAAQLHPLLLSSAEGLSDHYSQRLSLEAVNIWDSTHDPERLLALLRVHVRGLSRVRSDRLHVAALGAFQQVWFHVGRSLSESKLDPWGKLARAHTLRAAALDLVAALNEGAFLPGALQDRSERAIFANVVDEVKAEAASLVLRSHMVPPVSPETLDQEWAETLDLVFEELAKQLRDKFLLELAGVVDQLHQGFLRRREGLLEQWQANYTEECLRWRKLFPASSLRSFETHKVEVDGALRSVHLALTHDYTTPTPEPVQSAVQRLKARSEGLRFTPPKNPLSTIRAFGAKRT